MQNQSSGEINLDDRDVMVLGSVIVVVGAFLFLKAFFNREASKKKDEQMQETVLKEYKKMLAQ